MSQKRKTMLYFAPHQDDELLSMGIDICTSLQDGCDVHVILCSDGSKSSVRNTLNNGKTCPKHAGEHVYELSIEEFIQARDREFRGSCKALGVADANVHIAENRGIDGSLTEALSECIIKQYLSQYGENALVCTIAPDNGKKQHRDHKALGRAADNLLKKGIIKEVKFFIEPYHVTQVEENPRLVPIVPSIEKASAEASSRIKAAISSYSYWNPAELRYAVGYHSVTNEFNDFLKEQKSYSYKKKDLQYMRFLEKKKWNNSAWQQLQKRTQVYYSISTSEQPDLGELECIEIKAHDANAYKEFCSKYNIKLTDKNANRIKDGSSYWCLVTKNQMVVCDGWLAYKQHFYIGETDFGFDMNKSESAILYNFNTKDVCRGKGYYGLLLKSIVHQAKGPKQFIIYTAPDNTSSQRGITKAGFTCDGTLTATTDSLKAYLIKAGFTSIARKVKRW